MLNFKAPKPSISSLKLLFRRLWETWKTKFKSSCEIVLNVRSFVCVSFILVQIYFVTITILFQLEWIYIWNSPLSYSYLWESYMPRTLTRGTTIYLDYFLTGILNFKAFLLFFNQNIQMIFMFYIFGLYQTTHPIFKVQAL